MVAAIASFLSISAGLNYSPAYQFFLYTHVNLSRDNRFVVSFNIILWNDAGVLNSGLVKKISGVRLLEKGVTHVLLVAEDLVDGAGVPARFTSAGKNTICFKACCYLIHTVAFKVLSVDLKQLLQNTKYSIHYYQREYMWQRKHIEELIDDLTSEFLEYYKTDDPRQAVADYGAYFMGSIVLAGRENAIIDG